MCRTSYNGGVNIPVRKTNEEFITQLYKLNPNIEILSTYINNYEKVLCRCKIDKYEWYASPNKLLMKRGCPRCAKKEPYTETSFIERLSVINPDVELLSHFIRGSHPIKCRCKIDGYEWESTPYRLIRGNGCVRCKNREQIDNDEFLKRLSNVTLDIRPITEYKNTETVIRCVCKKCNHEWNARPSHLLRGVGCPKCAGIILKTTNEFVLEMQTLCPNINVIGEYRGNKRKILCKCNMCDYEWKSTPNSLLRGRAGCPSCRGSHGEKLIGFHLDQLNIEYICQHRFEDCRDYHSLPFDFYLPDFNILIEYDGEQHYRPVNFGGKTKEKALQQFKTIQKHDLIKNEYCDRNQIALIRIPYTETDNIKNILDKFMF